MSTEGQPQQPAHDFDLRELATALFARRNITSGLWRLAAKLRFAAITANMPGPSKAGAGEHMPASLVGIEGIALFPVDEPGSLVYDAAKLNPKKAAGKVSAKASTPKRQSATKRAQQRKT